MFNNYTYLYVEDDPLSREIMQMAMEEVIGITNFTIFGDSVNIMERIKSLPRIPDVILLDIHMEPYNGFDILKMLRREADFEAVKIIALTASVMYEEVEELRQHGFDGAIGKPLDVRTFPDLLKRIINGEIVWHIS
jgi:CheY-like chemotaxis protein